MNFLPWLAAAAWAWHAGWFAATPTSSPVSVASPFVSGGEQKTVDGWVHHYGPWGKLEYHWIQLDTPAEFIPAEEASPGPTRWYFDAPTVIEARRKLIEWGFPDRLADELDSVSDLWEPAAEGGGYLLPPTSVVEGLSVDERRRIYERLTLHPKNDVYVFMGDDIGRWFDGSSVPRAVVDLVRQVSFRRGNVHFFADKQLALAKCADDAQRLELVRCINRRATVVGRLRLDESTNYDELVRYWFPDRRPQGVETLLRGMAASGSEPTVDLIHVLSPFARERLYTFPLADRPFADQLNCGWTAIHYFDVTVPDQNLSREETALRIRDDFYPVNSAPSYGDLALFLSPKSRDQLVHVAVYLAGDLLFSKNGNTARNPWVLMPLQELKDLYSHTDSELVVRFYRAKPYSATGSTSP